MLGNGELRVTRTDGATLASSWADLIDGSIANPLQYDENGVFIGAQFAWTDTDTDGTQIDADDCIDWTSSDTVNRAWIGRTNQTGSSWTNGLSVICSAAHHLYCFEQ